MLYKPKYESKYDVNNQNEGFMVGGSKKDNEIINLKVSSEENISKPSSNKFLYSICMIPK